MHLLTLQPLCVGDASPFLPVASHLVPSLVLFTVDLILTDLPASVAGLGGERDLLFHSKIAEETERDPWKCCGCACRTNVCHAHICSILLHPIPRSWQKSCLVEGV